MEKSLAEYISKLREKAGLSIQGLSKKSAIPIEEIEDIESGKELFLASTIRQKLAKCLKVNPSEIKEYEKIIIDSFDCVSIEYIQLVKKAILEGETENLRCPICSSKLNSRIVRLLDLENNVVMHAKAHCSKCSFQIK